MLFNICKAILVSAILVSSVVAQAKEQSTTRSTVNGTVVAYDHFYFLLPCYHICTGRMIVRVENSEKQTEYITVTFRYGDRHFPDDLLKKSKSYRMVLTREPERDGPLEEFVRQRNDKGEEVPSKLKSVALLPGAEKERLPFGQTLRAYSLAGDVFDLIKQK